MGAGILNKIMGKDLAEKTFQQRPEGGGASQENHLSDTRHSEHRSGTCKGPGVGVCLVCAWSRKEASVAGVE